MISMHKTLLIISLWDCAGDASCAYLPSQAHVPASLLAARAQAIAERLARGNDCAPVVSL